MGKRNVKPMLAPARTVTDQRGGGAKTDQVARCRRQSGGAGQGTACHRDRRIGTAGLRRYETQISCKSLLVVRHLRLDQKARATGHTQQRPDRPAAAPRDGEHSLVT
ncbi:MAG: hypothetical protein AB7O80_23955 [Acetobacteraceae bacterium]